MYLNNTYYVKQNAVSKEIYNKIIKLGQKKKFKKGEILEGNQNNRSSKISWITDKTLDLELIKPIQYVNHQAGWNFSLFEFEPFQYTVYDKNDFYNYHIDSLSEPYPNGLIRKLSFTLCLNDSYEGGELEITVPNPKEEDEISVIDLKAFKPGTMLVFPSFIWHRVKPVTKGTRKVLVGWVLGNQWS